MTRTYRYLSFIYIFFCTGFVLGTLTLSLVVESLLTYMHRNQWLVDYENALVIGIIIIFVMYSFFIALWLTSIYLKLSHWFSKFIFLLLLTSCVAFSLWYWLTPKKHDKNTEYVTSANGRFVAGPYPDKLKMNELKHDGYTAIISLLSPYVVPFEPILLEKEVTNAKQVGIPLIHLPMLPWITKNTDSIKKIEILAKENNNNKYYVHCYYGRDRVSMFMRIVDNASPQNGLSRNNHNNSGISDKKLLPLERGKALAIDNHVIFGPTPTEDELTYYIINLKRDYFNEPIRKVIIINSTEISKAETELKNFGVTLDILTIEEYPYPVEKIFDLSQQIKHTSGAVFVYTFYTDPNPKPIVLEGIMLSYLSNLPAIPKQVFAEIKMQNGKPELIAPNIVLGPKPVQDEYANVLHYRGIRALAYIGNCTDSNTKTEKENAKNAKLEFKCFSPDDKTLIETISKKGPWYIYNFSTGMEDNLETTFAKSFPDMTATLVKINDVNTGGS